MQTSIIVDRIVRRILETATHVADGIGNSAYAREQAAIAHRQGLKLLEAIIDAKADAAALGLAAEFDSRVGDGKKLIEEYILERAFRRTETA